MFKHLLQSSQNETLRETNHGLGIQDWAKDNIYLLSAALTNGQSLQVKNKENSSDQK